MTVTVPCTLCSVYHVDVILYFSVIGLLGLIPHRSESFFSSQNIHVSSSEAYSSSCSVGTRDHLPWVKAARVVGLTTGLHKVPRLTVWSVTPPQDNCVSTVVWFFEIL